MLELVVIKSQAVPAAWVSAHSAVLSAQEQAYASACQAPARRHEYRLSRIVLRQWLGAKLARAPETLQFAPGAHGKWQLTDLAWQCNLSHSHGLLVLAFAPQGALGVDVECRAPGRDPLPLAKRFFAASEYAWLCALPAPARHRAFLRLWARKEAVLKAHGGGISAGLDKIIFPPDALGELSQRLENQLDEHTYQLHDWPLGHGWLALATQQAATCELTHKFNSAAVDLPRVYQLDADLKFAAVAPTLLPSFFATIDLLPSEMCP
ncbi:MAG: 4'-phosphopantetheinyl transferase family protein [Aeromonas sp.]